MAVTGVVPAAGAVTPPMAAMLIFASCAGGSGLSGLSSPQENRAIAMIAVKKENLKFLHMLLKFN